jgi:hypothetical protein
MYRYRYKYSDTTIRINAEFGLQLLWPARDALERFAHFRRAMPPNDRHRIGSTGTLNRDFGVPISRECDGRASYGPLPYAGALLHAKGASGLCAPRS